VLRRRGAFVVFRFELEAGALVLELEGNGRQAGARGSPWCSRRSRPGPGFAGTRGQAGPARGQALGRGAIVALQHAQYGHARSGNT
jgi:hypothetical protein